MTVTITIQIGNTDNKLTQQEWSEFVYAIRTCLDDFGVTTYFFGGSSNWEPWQNTAWVFGCDYEKNLDFIKAELIELRKRFKQDSIAWNESETQFV